MEMLLRTIFLFLNYLKYRLKYKDNIWFRGFAVIYAEKGSSITFSKVGRSNIFSHPFSNMIGLSQRCSLLQEWVVR